MADRDDRMCVLLPCGAGQRWALPQACLAEILTLQLELDAPPPVVDWRGLQVPVLDLGAGGAEPWFDTHSGTGLVAVLLGLEGADGACWALALRGEGLGVRQLLAEDCEDRPEEVRDYALAAFAVDAVTYQVPDLPALQARARAAAA